jgi:hypothetical protein
VDAVQTWKKPGQDMGDYGHRGQYLYRCPRSTCRHQVVHPDVLPAAAAIDWTLPPGPRIGDRRRPLKPATLARIEAGLRRYAGVPMLAPAGGTWRAGPVNSTVEVILNGVYFRPADRRPSKAISKAFKAAFHRFVQRCRPRPVGSRDIVVRYRHFRAACSVGK